MPMCVCSFHLNELKSLMLWFLHQEAEILGLEDEMRLLRNKKLVLLVDLDQTLIHTTNENVERNLKRVHHFQLYGPRSPWYHTRIRPFTMEVTTNKPCKVAKKKKTARISLTTTLILAGLFQFLENVSKLYELHICTFGARMYAHKIATILDPERKYFSHRILSRDECFDSRSKTANLS